VKIFRTGFVFLAIASFGWLARATTVIYPVEAIDDLWQLQADDFRQKYGGINITGLGPNDEGWYVRYRHENLTYLFGPVADREEARRKKWDMETVRDAAIRNRPSLASSQVDFVRFTYSGVYGKGGNSPYGGADGPRVSKDGRSGPEGDLDGDGIANNRDDDMDGDGISNDKDGDMDGDGVPNGGDDYAFGTDPAKTDGTGAFAKDGSGNGADGNGDGSGNNGNGQDGSNGTKGGMAGMQDGNGNQAGGQNGQGGGDGSSLGQSGTSGSGQQGSSGQRGRQVASNQRGRMSGQGNQAGSMGDSSGQGGQDGGQSGQSGSSGGSSGGQSGSSGGSSGGPAGGGGGSGGNPLTLLSALMRLILGL
jgi:hypothetical protein